MKQQSGFALLQVLLFGLLVIGIIYGVMMVETKKVDLRSVDKNATTVGPALTPFLQYVITETISTYQEDQVVSELTYKGSNYYTDENPLNGSYVSDLEGIGFYPDNVIIVSDVDDDSVALES